MSCSLFSPAPSCSLLPVNFDFHPTVAMGLDFPPTSTMDLDFRPTSTMGLSVLTVSETPPAQSHLNITTVAAANGLSTLECWQLSAPFTQSSTPGTSGALNTQLGESGTSSFTTLPPEFDGGLHNAPAVQYVLLSYLHTPTPTHRSLLPFSKFYSQSPRITISCWLLTSR